MSAKAQLVSLVDTVASIAKESEPSAAERSRALDAIKVLLDTKVTLQLLKETQAGKTLKKVAKCKDKEIAKQAGEVVEKWMDVIRSAVAKDDSLRKQDANTPSSSQREASAREATTGSKAVTFESTGNSKRDKVREKLVEALMSQEADPEAVKRAAESIEEAMFVQYSSVTKDYLDKYRALAGSLKDPKNADLRDEILSGKLRADELTKMSSEQLASQEIKGVFDKMRAESLHAELQVEAEQATTDEFRCGKCGQRRCTFYQKQTRSADEPMTTFITCVNCGNKWREY